MGLDSLMAVEMRNWIESQMEISLPIAALMRSASLSELIEKVSDIIAGSASDAGSKVPKQNSEPASAIASDSQGQITDQINGQQASELLDQLHSLDDSEVSQLLARMLGEK